MRTGGLKGRTCKGLAKVTRAGIAASREGRVQQVRITSPKDEKKSATFKRSQTNACSNAAHLCSPMPNTKPFVVHAGYMAESENIASQIGLAGNDSKCRK